MGENFDIGSIAFPPRDSVVDMTVEVDRKSPWNIKLAIWIQDASGAIWVARAKAIRRPGKIELLILEDASGSESIVSVVSYGRLGQPKALESGVELKDADGNSNLDLRFRAVKSAEGDTTVLWTP